MKPTNQDTHSWKQFWRFQAHLTPLVALLATLFSWGSSSIPPYPTFGRALILGLVATLGSVFLGSIHRGITGRNNLLGIFSIIAVAVIPRDAAHPLAEQLHGQVQTWLLMAIFISVVAFLERAWANRNSRRPVPPTSRSEIDAGKSA